MIMEIIRAYCCESGDLNNKFGLVSKLLDIILWLSGYLQKFLMQLIYGKSPNRVLF